MEEVGEEEKDSVKRVGSDGGSLKGGSRTSGVGFNKTDKGGDPVVPGT